MVSSDTSTVFSGSNLLAVTNMMMAQLTTMKILTGVVEKNPNGFRLCSSTKPETIKVVEVPTNVSVPPIIEA